MFIPFPMLNVIGRLPMVNGLTLKRPQKGGVLLILRAYIYWLSKYVGPLTALSQ